MQLKRNGIASALGLLAANLLSAGPALAQDNGDPASGDATDERINAYDETASEVGTTVVDSAVLVYRESGHRVRAVEPVISVVHNASNGDIYSAKFTYDTLTGASPNGATPSIYPQTFITPIQAESGQPDGQLAVTGASGTFIAPAHKLPIDSGFKDRRKAIDLGYSTQIAPDARFSVGVDGSKESDYRSISGRFGVTSDFNNKNTVVALGVNYEHDVSKPIFGTPVPLGSMGDSTGVKSRVKNVYSAVIGVTQVMTPEWLVQLNYSYGRSTGYHNDPYKLVSLINSADGSPFWYIYESRPETRVRQSVYLGTKFAVGSIVTDASARLYHDSWGIDSVTFELSQRLPVGRDFFIEPGVRYYHQTAAKFFRHYLTLEEPTPDYVSADSRLGKFSAVTFGVKFGGRITDNLEFYGMFERYRQYGKSYYSDAPGVLSRLDLFGGMKSTSMIAGLKVTFR